MSDGADLDLLPTALDAGISESVPVIDIGGLIQGDSKERAIREIASACRDWGFFQVENHGVPEQLIADVWRETQRFFAQPLGDKESILRSRNNPWGYYNNELTKNQRDKKEVFDFTSAGTDPVYAAANRWPDIGHRFQAVMEGYRDACVDLSLKLLEAMSAGLGVEADYLNCHFHPVHTGFIRLNYYPVADPMASRDDVLHQSVADRGVHHHSDAGALTVLLQDEIGGLQVFRGGYWHNVTPRRNAFVINTGDMMQVWSNDRYQAAIHRVLAMTECDRFSIPFFYNPNAGTEVSPLPSVVSESNPANYRTINWSEFRSRRTDGDYADYGNEVQISQYRTQANENQEVTG